MDEIKECVLCHKVFKRLGIHVILKHKISWKKYLEAVSR